MAQLLGGIETGGTSIVCEVAERPDADPIARTEFHTTTPPETIGRMIEFFKSYSLTALGIASFGPINLREGSPTYGYVTDTPKVGWSNINLLGPLHDAFNLPIGFDTDVNTAALGEYRYGAGKGVSTVVYITVGTGIGGGAIVDGKPLHGLIHPEMGHVIVRRHPDDTFIGACPFHLCCLEGMAAGPALEKRWGKKGHELPPGHPAWVIEADYLAQAIASIFYVLSPERVILGGGVMNQLHLFPLIQRRVRELLNNYLQHPAILQHLDSVIVPPKFGDRAGVVGALELAAIAAARGK